MIKYSKVLGELGTQRDEVLAEFKLSRGNRERWTKPDWLKMATAITHAEDAIEYRLAKSHSPSGVRLRQIRRQLELVVGD